MQLDKSIQRSWDNILRGHEVQGLRDTAGTLLSVPEEYGSLQILNKADFINKQELFLPQGAKTKQRPELPEMIVGGYASPQVVDKEKHLITKEAMQADLPRFLAHPHYRNVMVVHTNIQVGEVLPEWTHPGTGETYKTKVDEVGLFAVVKIRTDPFRPAIVDQVIKDIESGELAAFSISGDAPYESRKYQCADGTCFWVINEIEHYEITLCQKGVNQDAKYAILSKSAFCQDGRCPLPLPSERITVRAVRSAVAKASVYDQGGGDEATAGSIDLGAEAPKPPSIAGNPGQPDGGAGTGATGNMQGGNEGADVGERAGGTAKSMDLHAEHDQSDHGTKSSGGPVERNVEIKKVSTPEASYGRGRDNYRTAAGYGVFADGKQVGLITNTSSGRYMESGDWVVSRVSDGKVIAGNLTYQKSFKEVKAWAQKNIERIESSGTEKSMEDRTPPNHASGQGPSTADELFSEDEQGRPDEHRRAVEFLWQHGLAYVAGSHQGRSAKMSMGEGDVTIELNDGRSVSSGKYSADQVNDAVQRVMKFVQTGGREHGPMDLNFNPLDKGPMSSPNSAGHVQDIGAQQQPGPKTRSKSGTVSDPVYDELDLPTGGPEDMEKATDVLPGIVASPHSRNPGTITQAETCQHGCFATVEDVEEQEQQQPPQPGTVSKAEKLPDDPYLNEHGHTNGDDEYYLNKAADTDTIVICVVQSPQLQPDVVLMARRTDDEMGDLVVLPGGHAREGESLGQAAQRELLEETGVEAKPVRLLGDDGNVYFMLLEQTGGSPTDTEEMREVGFRRITDVETVPSNLDAVAYAQDVKLSKGGEQSFGPGDIEANTDRGDEQEEKSLTITNEPVKQTDGLNVRKSDEGHPHGRSYNRSPSGDMFPWQRQYSKNCPLCETEQVLERALDVREWRTTASSDLRLMSRFALEALKNDGSLSYTSGRWFAFGSAEGGLLRKDLAVELGSLVSMVGKHALEIGQTELWGAAYQARGQVDKLTPVTGQGAYGIIEALVTRLVRAGNIEIASVMAGNLLAGTLEKGYGFGWYSNAQRTLARAASTLRQQEAEAPADMKTALGAILEDIDQLEAQLGVTREMEKGTIHEEATQSELDVAREVAKDTEINVADADEKLAAVGARDPEPSLSAEPASALNDPAQQTMPANVAVRTGAPDYVARAAKKFVDPRSGGGLG